VLHRVLGSIGFVAAARIVLAVAEDPDDSTRRLLLPVKSNICAPAPTLAYRVVQTLVDTDDGEICETLRIDWEDGAVNVQVDDVFRGAREDASERIDAEDFIREAHCPQHAVSRQEQARGSGKPRRRGGRLGEVDLEPNSLTG
jgi:hypothetical protein